MDPRHVVPLLVVFVGRCSFVYGQTNFYPVDDAADCLEVDQSSTTIFSNVFNFLGVGGTISPIIEEISFFSLSMKVYKDGVISFESNEILEFPLSPLPTDDPGTLLIAPFAAEIDLSLGGSVCVEEVVSPAIRNEIGSYIDAFFPSLTFQGESRPVIITWKDVTFPGSTDESLTNTFQVVILPQRVSNFGAFIDATFVMINYGRMNWVTDTYSGSPAQVGLNAGDGVCSFELPGSGTNDIINIATSTNTDRLGRFVYRVDQKEIQGFVCASNGLVGLSPSSGVMMGGTPVTITGPCYAEVSDLQIVCKFGNVMVPGEMKSDFIAECCTPECLQVGPVNVNVSLDNGSTFPFSGNFIYLSPLDVAPLVTRVEPPVWKQCPSEYTITWDDAFFTGTVNIEVVGYCNSAVPNLAILHSVSNVANTGTYVFSNVCLPSSTVNCERIGAIRVTGNVKSTILWSDFIPLNWIISSSDTNAEWCANWHQMENDGDMGFLSSRQPCPCTRQQSLNDGGRFSPLPECNLFSSDSNNCAGKPGVNHCVRARQPNSAGGGQECCYSTVSGRLTSNQNGCDGGFSYRAHHTGVPPYKAAGKVPWLSYLFTDEYPRVICCEWANLCNLYKEVRPPQSCAGYVQIRPAVCGGDPHIQTLDGVRYTFNGHSEFTMLEVGNKEVVLQARNLPLTEGAQATVIKAVGICVANKDTIHVAVGLSGGLDVWVKVNLVANPEWKQVDFSDSKTLTFNGFTVTKGSNPFFTSTGSVQISYDFGLGLYFDGETGGPGAITILSTGLQPTSPAKGLLGVWNDDQSDDFTPNSDSAIPIPISSSPEDIHNMFGLTWRIDEAESCLYYGPGESHDGFTNLGFMPSFDLPENINISPEDLNAVCGDNDFCAFDFLATGDETFGSRTLEYLNMIDMISASTTGFETCPPLENPTNGISLIESALPGGTATYQCFSGFIISEEVTRNCQADLAWSGLAPSCIAETSSCEVADAEFSCIVQYPFVGAKEDKDVSIYAIPAVPFNPSDVCFTRSFDTGAGTRLPPFKVNGVVGINKGKVLTLPVTDRRPGKRFGVFACVAQLDNCKENLEVCAVVTKKRKGLIPTDGRITKTVNIEDDVKLAVTRPNAAPQRTRWLKNGQQIPAWNGRNYVIIQDAMLNHQGIYEVFRRGRRMLNQHTVIILYVRGCPDGTFGISCENSCSCINGGLCDELTGKCTCPPGYSGNSCENAEAVAICSTVLGRKVSNDCRGFLFCLPGKFGCICGPGFYGIDCQQKCRYGFFGAGCTEKCPKGTHCDSKTGA